jgi:hypothetical protein
MSVRTESAPRVDPASMPSVSFKCRVVCGASVFLASLGLYVWTLAPTVTLVDSGELIVAARTLGVAHPPGFPLYVLLAHLSTLAPVGSVAERVNFASAVFAAVAAALLSLAVLEAIATIGEVSRRAEASGAEAPRAEARRRKRGARGRAVKAPVAPLLAPTWSNTVLPAITAGLLFACSRTIWSYATIAEVYALNTMLIALMVLCMFRWRRLILDDGIRTARAGGEANEHDRWLKVAALVFGLALGVHHVTVGLVLPAFAALVVATAGWRFFWGKRLAIASVFAFAGLGVYVYLPIAASRSPLINWGDPRTLERFLSHVTGWLPGVFRGKARTHRSSGRGRCHAHAARVWAGIAAGGVGAGDGRRRIPVATFAWALGVLGHRGHRQPCLQRHLGPGSGNTDPDWVINDPGPKVSPARLGVRLRAERAGGGTGRVYTINVSCSDASGNTTAGNTTVTVVHDQR